MDRRRPARWQKAANPSQCPVFLFFLFSLWAVSCQIRGQNFPDYGPPGLAQVRSSKIWIARLSMRQYLDPFWSGEGPVCKQDEWSWCAQPSLDSGGPTWSGCNINFYFSGSSDLSQVRPDITCPCSCTINYYSLLLSQYTIYVNYLYLQLQYLMYNIKHI